MSVSLHYCEEMPSLLVLLFTVFYVFSVAIPCISEEDKFIADKMGFTYTNVMDDDVIVHSGQVKEIHIHILITLYFWFKAYCSQYCRILIQYMRVIVSLTKFGGLLFLLSFYFFSFLLTAKLVWSGSQKWLSVIY